MQTNSPEFRQYLADVKRSKETRFDGGKLYRSFYDQSFGVLIAHPRENFSKILVSDRGGVQYEKPVYSAAAQEKIRNAQVLANAGKAAGIFSTKKSFLDRISDGFSAVVQAVVVTGIGAGIAGIAGYGPAGGGAQAGPAPGATPGGGSVVGSSPATISSGGAVPSSAPTVTTAAKVSPAMKYVNVAKDIAGIASVATGVAQLASGNKIPASGNTNGKAFMQNATSVDPNNNPETRDRLQSIFPSHYALVVLGAILVLFFFLKRR